MINYINDVLIFQFLYFGMTSFIQLSIQTLNFNLIKCLLINQNSKLIRMFFSFLLNEKVTFFIRRSLHYRQEGHLGKEGSFVIELNLH